MCSSERCIVFVFFFVIYFFREPYQCTHATIGVIEIACTNLASSILADLGSNSRNYPNMPETWLGCSVSNKLPRQIHMGPHLKYPHTICYRRLINNDASKIYNEWNDCFSPDFVFTNPHEFNHCDDYVLVQTFESGTLSILLRVLVDRVHVVC